MDTIQGQRVEVEQHLPVLYSTLPKIFPTIGGGELCVNRTLQLFVLVCALLPPAWPQDPAGTLEGRVIDESGGVIVGASSTLTNLSTGLGFEHAMRINTC